MQLSQSPSVHASPTVHRDAKRIYKLLWWVKSRIGILFLEAASKKGITQKRRVTKKLINKSCAEVGEILKKNRQAKTYDPLIQEFIKTTLTAEWSSIDEAGILRYAKDFYGSTEASPTDRTTISLLLATMGMNKEALDNYLLLPLKSHPITRTEDTHK